MKLRFRWYRPGLRWQRLSLSIYIYIYVYMYTYIQQSWRLCFFRSVLRGFGLTRRRGCSAERKQRGGFNGSATAASACPAFIDFRQVLIDLHRLRLRRPVTSECNRSPPPHIFTAYLFGIVSMCVFAGKRSLKPRKNLLFFKVDERPVTCKCNRFP